MDSTAPSPAVDAAAALYHAGRHDQAERALQALLTAGERDMRVPYLLGLLAAGRGDNAQADRLLAQALEQAPNHAEALRNHGVILRRLGRPQAALARLDAALAAAPDDAASHVARANLLNDLQRWDEALAASERALAIAPSLATAANAQGNALAGQGRDNLAIASYRRAADLSPTYADPRLNLGNARLRLGQAAAALGAHDAALVIAPGLADAWMGRGNALAFLRRWPAAAAAYDQAWALDPAQPFLTGSRLHARMKICDWSTFETDLQALRAAIGEGRAASVPFPLLALPLTPREHRAAAARYAASAFPAPPAPEPGPRDPEGPIRLAYVSGDFHDHATAYLIAELIELHDRARVEVIGISLGPVTRDPMRRRLEAAFDRFFDVSTLEAAAVADLCRGLGVDIAIDLKGYTTGARPAIFAARAAPIQVNYLGYPGTMAAAFMDYVVADPVVIPPAARGDYSEKIAYLAGCYQPNDRRRPRPVARTVREDHGLPGQGFVFASFNNNYKIMPDVFALWMRLLQAVEGSVLWLFQDNPEAAANLRAAAEGHGVDPARLVFAGFEPLEQHLERHHHVDLFLDTAPYNAHTTASDALWMDTPMVTLLDEGFAGRVGASLLTAAGLAELVTGSWAAYEALALALARDPERLRQIRGRLAGGKLESRLFDTPRLTRELESLYVAMHERRRRGLAPDHLFAADQP